MKKDSSWLMANDDGYYRKEEPKISNIEETKSENNSALRKVSTVMGSVAGFILAISFVVFTIFIMVCLSYVAFRWAFQ